MNDYHDNEIPGIFPAPGTAPAPNTKRVKGNAKSGKVLIACLDESYTDSTTGERVRQVRQVPFRVRLRSVCDHREGSICTVCASRWQLDYDFKGVFPFPRVRRASIAELINDGAVRPGMRVDSGHGFSAIITEDGGLLLPDGRIFHNQTAARIAGMNPLPARPTPVGGDLPDVPADCWHVERIRHYPESDPHIVIILDAADATQAEQRALAWARHPDSGIPAELGEHQANAHTDIGSGRWAVVVCLNGE